MRSLVSCAVLITRHQSIIAEPHKQPIFGKQRETHELIFSWLSWLAVLLVGAYDDGGGDDETLDQVDGIYFLLRFFEKKNDLMRSSPI